MNGGALLAGMGVVAALTVSGGTTATADPSSSPTPTDTTSPPATTPPPETSTPTPDPTPTPTPTPTEPETPTPDPTPTPTPTETPPTDTPTPTPTPTPTSPTPTPTPTPSQRQRLAVELSPSGTTVRPGDSITVTAHFWAFGATAKGAALRVDAPGASVSPAKRGIGELDSSGGHATVTVRVPDDAAPGVITVTGRVSATGIKTASRSFALTVTDPSGTVPPADDLDGVPAGALSAPDLPTGLPATPAPGLLADLKAPQVALPPVASPQVAPQSLATVPMSSLRALPDETSSIEQLGALQAGVLAALGSAVALAILRIRLSRRSGPAPARRVYGRTYGRVDRHGRPDKHGVRIALLPAEPYRPRT